MAMCFTRCFLSSLLYNLVLQILATCEEMIPAVMKFTHLVIEQFSSCTSQRLFCVVHRSAVFTLEYACAREVGGTVRFLQRKVAGDLSRLLRYWYIRDERTVLYKSVNREINHKFVHVLDNESYLVVSIYKERTVTAKYVQCVVPVTVRGLYRLCITIDTILSERGASRVYVNGY